MDKTFNRSELEQLLEILSPILSSREHYEKFACSQYPEVNLSLKVCLAKKPAQEAVISHMEYALTAGIVAQLLKIDDHYLNQLDKKKLKNFFIQKQNNQFNFVPVLEGLIYHNNSSRQTKSKKFFINTLMELTHQNPELKNEFHIDLIKHISPYLLNNQHSNSLLMKKIGYLTQYSEYPSAKEYLQELRNRNYPEQNEINSYIDECSKKHQSNMQRKVKKLNYQCIFEDKKSLICHFIYSPVTSDNLKANHFHQFFSLNLIQNLEKNYNKESFSLMSQERFDKKTIFVFTGENVLDNIKKNIEAISQHAHQFYAIYEKSANYMEYTQSSNQLLSYLFLNSTMGERITKSKVKI